MKKEKEYKLTIKQEAFARAYVETGNASEAYRRAYNAENMQIDTVKKRASELLSRGDIKGTVQKLKDEIASRHEITVDSLVNELEEARLAALTAESPQTGGCLSGNTKANRQRRQKLGPVVLGGWRKPYTNPIQRGFLGAIPQA